MTERCKSRSFVYIPIFGLTSKSGDLCAIAQLTIERTKCQSRSLVFQITNTPGSQIYLKAIASNKIIARSKLRLPPGHPKFLSAAGA